LNRISPDPEAAWSRSGCHGDGISELLSRRTGGIEEILNRSDDSTPLTPERLHGMVNARLELAGRRPLVFYLVSTGPYRGISGGHPGAVNPCTRAGYRSRTDDIQLGKLTLYQLS
jgi:hypothetical protein